MLIPLGRSPGLRRRRLRNVSNHSSPEPLSRPAAAYPPIAAKATDLEVLKKAVEDAASVSGGLWLSYLFVLFYLAVAAGAVTHVDLFLERPVKLPFLNIELPLLAFFFLAPILFCLTHTYTLVHFVLLTDKAKHFHAELRKQIKPPAESPGNTEAFEICSALRRQLPSNIFVQFLAGPEDLRDSWFGFLLKSIAWATLVVGPILLLLLLQIQFLPYHNSLLTWTHRLALLVDLAILWWLWRSILSGRGEVHPWGRWMAWLAPSLGILLSCCALIFSWTVATYPGEWQEDHLPSWSAFRLEDKPAAKYVSLHDLLFNLNVDSVRRRRTSYLSSTLVLPGLNLYEALRIDAPEKVKWHEFIFLARGRDLGGAVLDLAVLPQVDFEGAQLDGASLFGAKLEGASFSNARLRGASFRDAQLQGASFSKARLQGASFDNAQLQGAGFNDVPLQGATFNFAQLQDASFDGAQLEGASFDGAQLQGASFDNAQLQGASFRGALLQGGSFNGAQLQGASLSGAELQGALLQGAELQGSSLSGAQLQGASLLGAGLQGADFRKASFSSTDFTKTLLWRTEWSATRNSSVIKLEGANWNPVRYVKIARELEPEIEPWTPEAYDNLKASISNVPEGQIRERAIGRISRLDCSASAENLASCDASSRSLPQEVRTWQKWLVEQSSEAPAYQKALAESLRDLVCRIDDNAIYVLRGIADSIDRTGREAPMVVDFILSKSCALKDLLSKKDNEMLLSVKTSAIKRFALPGER